MTIQTEEASPIFLVLGIMLVAGYAGWYLVWHNINIQQYENLPLRIACSVLGIPLIFYRVLPSAFKKIMPIYWFFSLTFLFPFFFTFMFLKNNGSIVWQLNSATALVLLILLADWVTIAITVFIGVCSAWICYVLTTPMAATIPFDFPSVVGAVGNYLALALFCGLFMHNKTKYHNEKLNAIEMASQNVAHELGTPLATINAGAKILNNYLPELFRGYEAAINNNLISSNIRANQLEKLKTILGTIKSETNNANLVIKMLLVNASQNKKTTTEGFVECKISDCVNEAIARYPFPSKEDKKLIFWDGSNDFSFRGNQELTIHILFNLIKNAIYYIKAKRKGSIELRAEKGVEYNYFYFKDTGPGMNKEALSKLFNRFYSNTYHGYGIGLSFCKNVMKRYGGDITCRSSEGEYTEFILKFPKD